MFRSKASSMSPTGKRNRTLPPRPRGYLLFQLPKLQNQPLEYLGGIWQKYGDLVRLPIMPGFTLLLGTHPNHAEHILLTHQERYKKADFFLKPMGLVQGEGLFTSEGESWLKHRRLMQPAFQQKQLVNLYAVMQNCVQSLVTEWAKRPEDSVIDIAAEMTQITLKIVSMALFSVDISDKSNQLGQAFRTALNYVYYRLNTPLAFPAWIPTSKNRSFRQAKQTLDRVVLEIIQSRRQNPTAQHDLLSMLLATQDEETGKRMSDRQLLDEVITLINAGHETTATTLAWTWYLLGTHPHIMANLLHELDTILHDQAPTWQQISQLQYTRRVLDESLRLCPPGMGLAPRIALEDDEIQGYFIPKGSVFNIATYFIGRHPEFWHNPDQFDPDRFLPEFEKQRSKFAYLPFGGGAHSCIGKNFALMEATLILVMIAQRFHLKLVPNQPIAIDPQFTLRPKYGIKVTVRQRY
ncbi:MAG: cytochrome P450 [Symploca sp. SIO1C2]|nr:cytochrome P450 [Symploca sp. SIO1C2]